MSWLNTNFVPDNRILDELIERGDARWAKSQESRWWTEMARIYPIGSRDREDLMNKAIAAAMAADR